MTIALIYVINILTIPINIRQIPLRNQRFDVSFAPARLWNHEARCLGLRMADWEVCGSNEIDLCVSLLLLKIGAVNYSSNEMAPNVQSNPSIIQSIIQSDWSTIWIHIWRFPQMEVPPKWMLYQGQSHENGWFGGNSVVETSVCLIVVVQTDTKKFIF